MPIAASRTNDELERSWADNKAYVRRVLNDLTHNVDLTEDLLQETHIKAAMGFAGHRGGSVTAWLGTIARNTFYSHARKLSYNRECPLDDDLSPSGGLEPGSGIHLGIMDMRSAIATLPSELRNVLIMKHYTGLTYEEIAARLKCPSGTVKNRVYQAVHQLRRMLGPPMERPICLSSAGTRLIDYLYGLTSAKETAETRQHLSVCSSCRRKAAEIKNVMDRLDELESSHKLMELLELDAQGTPTLYYDASIMNRSAEPLEYAAFRMNLGSTLLHVTAQGEEIGYEHDRDESFDWDSGSIVRGRYVARLPEPIAPGESLDLLTVSSMRPDRSAQQLSDGRFRFRWTQFPTLRWVDGNADASVGYSQAIRLPKGSRLLKVHPLPAEIRTDDKTTMIWQAMMSRFESFDCVVEYRVRPDWDQTS